jgi:hypothetical protein
MSDSDVQEVRDVVAKQKAEASVQQQTYEKMKQMAGNPAIHEDLEFIESMRSVSERMQARQEKDKRIGIQPGDA